MSKEKQVLGKGLNILFASEQEPEAKQEIKQDAEKSSAAQFIAVSEIHANPYQPRERFEEEALKELADSIRQKGVIQALTVRKDSSGNYQLIAGERRLRAAKMAGLDSVPAYIIDVETKEDLLEIALIENIQRKDLNAVETASGYQRLIDECGLTQEVVAEKVGKSRSAVTNSLRLLKLPEEVKHSIRTGEINEGHARAILSAPDDLSRINLWKKILSESLSVRKAEDVSKKLKVNKAVKVFNETDRDKAAISFLESKFREHFGTKVKVHPKSKTTGEIIIEYFTAEDLERIIDMCRK